MIATILPKLMRKIAADLRKEAAQQEHVHTEKCAQILVAARGLGVLQQLLKGAQNGPQ